ncbi:MAG: hypothetical protein LBC64_05335 [Fibromonadaceae bacterium]|jgi:hypothetical protein|nr:hypothetical protein [Fibromonadaceae bacterium]
MKKIFLCFFAMSFFSCQSLLEEDRYTKCDESRSYPYWSEWTVGGLISIVDDSLAVVSAYRYKTVCNYYEDIASSRDGLFLVNYRVKQKPLRGDTLESEYKMYNSYYMDHGLRILNGYLFRDTSALVFDLINNKFGFWKIGEKSIKFSDHDKAGYEYANTAGLHGATNAGHWENGSITFQTHASMNILDAEKGQIKQFYYSVRYDWMPGHEWMQKYLCNYMFLSYVGDKVVCVNNGYADNDSTFNTFLLVDGIPVDTIKPYINGTSMFGNYFIAQDRIFKIDTLNLKFDKDFSLWIDERPLKFCKNSDKNPDDCVSYSGQDLFQ